MKDAGHLVETFRALFEENQLLAQEEFLAAIEQRIPGQAADVLEGPSKRPPLPPWGLLARTRAGLQAMFKRSLANEAQSRSLVQLRDLLLARYCRES